MSKHLANLFADSLVQDPIGDHHNLDFIDASYRFIDSQIHRFIDQDVWVEML